MSTNPSGDTIVLIHGLWMTPLSRELYRDSQAVTELKEYPERSHFTVGQDGWEEVADHAAWASERAAALAAPR